MPFDLFRQGSSYTLTRQDGFTVSLQQALRTKRYVVLYIAGQWWAPCRGVTVQLKQFYAKFHETHDFEVIFLSTDRSKEAMLDFFHSAHGDWLCLDYKAARDLEAELAGDAELHPKQVPACLVFQLDKDAMLSSPAAENVTVADDSATESQGASPEGSGQSAAAALPAFAHLITKQGREMLSRDKEGVLFPWFDDGWKDKQSLQETAVLRKEKANGDSDSTAAAAATAAAADEVVDGGVANPPDSAANESTEAVEDEKPSVE